MVDKESKSKIKGSIEDKLGIQNRHVKKYKIFDLENVKPNPRNSPTDKALNKSQTDSITLKGIKTFGDTVKEFNF